VTGAVFRQLGPGALLRQLGARGVSLERDLEDGSPVIVIPDGLEVTEILLFHLRRYDWLFTAALIGADTGHEWMVCSSCDAVQLLAGAKAGRGCSMTFRCQGVMRRTGFVVPARRRVKKVAVEPVPLGISRRPRDNSSKSRSLGPKRHPAKSPARIGDQVALMACPDHYGPVWVKASLARLWRCRYCENYVGLGTATLADPVTGRLTDDLGAGIDNEGAL
jgi:hypothetical protein